jgi:tetratricopeptide (TPR) repeat protein
MMGSMSGNSVRLWEEPAIIPTYRPFPPDKNPMFIENRVYQGSSGRVYPNPITDRVSDEKTDVAWRAVHLENEYLYVMVLPEIGGRIHIGRDKTNGYDFFYRQNVIKPALVGLLGPWISGGVEFNWPQHHRPTTFMPTDVRLQEHRDGSKTVWLSEHEPMNRMKGMHGVCLYPGRSFIELKVQLYNRTPLMQTFLWWANAAVRVHEMYQSFFPPDVEYVVDHAKRAVSLFPQCDGLYYGVDYSKRGKTANGYPGNDLSWYANIPVPTSYMAMGSSRDFFGGYDHKAEAGVVHIANHRISPGKKQWTWGNHEFGYAWDRELTDADGPYVELMAGVFTDNQPDFSFLHPFETRSFRQFWYPIQKIGRAKHANLDAAVNIEQGRIGVSVTSVFPEARIIVENESGTILDARADISPGSPWVHAMELPTGRVSMRVLSRDGRPIIEYSRPLKRKKPQPPAPATEPPLPADIPEIERLYLTGLHLEQYRHATRRPKDYWREALRRDPADARSNNAMGLWHLRRGQFIDAERHFRAAVETLMRLNPNPRDGEPFFNLGLCLRYQDRLGEAYDAFYKAAWNYAWQSAAYFCIAQIDSREGNWEQALEHLEKSLATNVPNLRAYILKAAILRRLNRNEEADRTAAEALAIDPFADASPADDQMALDFALDFAEAGLWAEGIELLAAHDSHKPMVHYALGWMREQKGDLGVIDSYHRAAALPCDYCFPSRLEEIRILESAQAANPSDSKAFYYLGNLFYDRCRYDDAIARWQKSCDLNPRFATVHRNLGLAYYNARQDPKRAKSHYLRAFSADPSDARLLYELDQLLKRMNESPQSRLRRLQKYPRLVEERDDLSVELATLHNRLGQSDDALKILRNRRFHPWEGGEGLVLAQHVAAHLILGRRALREGKPSDALRQFQAASECPPNLAEARHLLAARADIDFALGTAYAAAGDRKRARQFWTAAAGSERDFARMAVRSFSDQTYWKAMALRALGKAKKSRQLLQELLSDAKAQLAATAAIDYFATSLPNLLLFEDDLQKRNETSSRHLMGLALAGLGRGKQAIAEFRRVLRLDASHLGARMALDSIQRGSK